MKKPHCRVRKKCHTHTHYNTKYLNFFRFVVKTWLGEPTLVVISLIECRGSIPKFETFLYTFYKLVAEF
jgi:hypothetical protein